MVAHTLHKHSLRVLLGALLPHRLLLRVLLLSHRLLLLLLLQGLLLRLMPLLCRCWWLHLLRCALLLLGTLHRWLWLLVLLLLQLHLGGFVGFSRCMLARCSSVRLQGPAHGNCVQQ